MQQVGQATFAARTLTLMIVLSAVGLSATTRARLPPAPSTTSRGGDTPVLEHIPGGGPDGGAVSSLAVVAAVPSSIVFAAFENGGVFRSSDRGATWTPADRGLPAADGCELVAVPMTPDSLFAACGDGLFKTTNAGRLWHQLDLDHALPPLVAPSDPRVVYQPPIHGTVRSRDGGRRWELLKTAAPSPCASAAIDPVDPFVLFCGSDEGMSVSRDGGASWRPAGKRQDSPNDISAIAIDPLRRNTILAGDDDGRIFETTTGGANWIALGAGPGSGSIEQLQFVGDSGVLCFARQGSSIVRSVDGGRAWDVVFTASPHLSILGPIFAVDPVAPSVIYVGTRQGVMVTTDAGAHWTIRNRGITRATTSVALHEGESPTLYASNGRDLVASEDDGASWTVVRLGGGGADDIVLSVESRGAEILARTPNTTYQLRPGETAWLPLAAPDAKQPLSLPSSQMVRMRQTGAGDVEYVVAGGRAEWRPVRLPNDRVPSAIAVAAGDANVLYASTGGALGGLLGHNGIWRSTDGGGAWQLVDEPDNRTIARCCGLLADPRDSRTVYAVLHGVGIGGDGNLIRRTIDGGDTWTELSHPGLALTVTVVPTDPVRLLVQVMDTTGAGQYALVSSTTRGDQWTRVGTGFPTNSRITNVVIDPRQPQRLFAATDGRGIYRSLDAGATWQPTGTVR